VRTFLLLLFPKRSSSRECGKKHDKRGVEWTHRSTYDGTGQRGRLIPKRISRAYVSHETRCCAEQLEPSGGFFAGWVNSIKEVGGDRSGYRRGGYRVMVGNSSMRVSREPGIARGAGYGISTYTGARGMFSTAEPSGDPAGAWGAGRGIVDYTRVGHVSQNTRNRVAQSLDYESYDGHAQVAEPLGFRC